MNYLQLTDRSTFATEEACLAKGFGEGNYVPFYAKKLIQGRIKPIRGDFVAGGLQVTLLALKRMGIEYHNDDYPTVLTKYLRRKIWKSDLKTIRRRVELGDCISSVFIKPANRVKRFTGMVISNRDDMVPISHIGGNLDLHCSESVHWISEYRVPVIQGEIQGYFWYSGDHSVSVDSSVVERMVGDYTASPSAYCLDVGVLDSGETALVEMNDAFSIGLYDGMECCYSKLLTTRWNELTNQAVP